MGDRPAPREGSDDDTSDVILEGPPPPPSGAQRDPTATLRDEPLPDMTDAAQTIEGPLPNLTDYDGAQTIEGPLPPEITKSARDEEDPPTIMDLGAAARHAVEVAQRKSSTPGKVAPPAATAKDAEEDAEEEDVTRPATEVEASTPVIAAVSSSLPTERPSPADRKRSLFAGLLAEAKDGGDGAAGNGSAAKLRVTVGVTKKPEPADREHQRKNQETLQIEGRGKFKKTAITSPPAPSGERNLGTYRVLGEIGVGGMAIVYKAVQPALDRLVAIKELRPEYVNDEQILARFEREATSLATLQHQNIVHIYDFVRDFDTAYIVMEYVEGIDVFDVLAETDLLPHDVAAVIALQIAAGMEYAHYRGIIHRDIKPSNILISKIGEVKIMDFGIARDPGRANITQVGMALGTPAYMAPEQIRGDEIDFRADIFSFGICLYEMLTGEKPWDDAGGTTVARKILYEDPVPPRRYNPEISPTLEAIIERCLHKDRDKRYATTDELRRELEGYVFRQVPEEPRQRLVVFLRNRHMITEGDASSFVPKPMLNDPILRRRDLGVATPPAQDLLKPVLIASAITFLAVVIAAILASFVPYGTRLADEPPALTPVTQKTTPQ